MSWCNAATMGPTLAASAPGPRADFHRPFSLGNWDPLEPFFSCSTGVFAGARGNTNTWLLKMAGSVFPQQLKALGVFAQRSRVVLGGFWRVFGASGFFAFRSV